MELGQIRLSADVGGTFTDVAAFDETTGELRLGKTLTTPHAARHRHRERRRPRRARSFAPRGCSCTAPRSRSTPSWSAPARRCALLTTQGFRDIYEIGRVNRPESYNLFFQKHEPLIDRDLRFEISERMDCAGHGADHARRGCRCGRRSRRRGRRRACRRSPSCSCTPTAIRRTSSAPRRSSSESYPDLFVTASHELSPGVPRVRAHLDRGGQRLCRAARAALSRRDGRPSRCRRLRRRTS